MRSPSDDTTSRARIRDAAIALFGAHGIDGVSVRRIAEAAEASPALVIHHYGSKDGLRRACDEHIVARVVGRKRDAIDAADGDLVSAMQSWLAEGDARRPHFDYLARMILDGSPTADALFDALVDRTSAMLEAGREAGTITPSSDPRATAAVLAAYGLMPLLLERHLGRALGEPGLTPGAIRRMTIPTLELYTYGLYSDTSMIDAARAALAGEPDTGPRLRSDKGPGEPNQDPDPPVLFRLHP